MKKQHQNPNGFHARFKVQKLYRVDGPSGNITYKSKPVDPKAEYFVLRLDEGGSDPNHIKACRIAINAYADSIEVTIPQLAKDLREQYPLIP